jgi:hypothetical protein
MVHVLVCGMKKSFILMKITGHSDIKTLNQYIGVSGSDVYEEFIKFEI